MPVNAAAYSAANHVGNCAGRQ